MINLFPLRCSSNCYGLHLTAIIGKIVRIKGTKLPSPGISHVPRSFHGPMGQKCSQTKRWRNFRPLYISSNQEQWGTVTFKHGEWGRGSAARPTAGEKVPEWNKFISTIPQTLQPTATHFGSSLLFTGEGRWRTVKQMAARFWKWRNTGVHSTSCASWLTMRCILKEPNSDQSCVCATHRIYIWWWGLDPEKRKHTRCNLGHLRRAAWTENEWHGFRWYVSGIRMAYEKPVDEVEYDGLWIVDHGWAWTSSLPRPESLLYAVGSSMPWEYTTIVRYHSG